MKFKITVGILTLLFLFSSIGYVLNLDLSHVKYQENITYEQESLSKLE